MNTIGSNQTKIQNSFKYFKVGRRCFKIISYFSNSKKW